jgi:N-acetylglucosamine PTS system EIIB component
MARLPAACQHLDAGRSVAYLYDSTTGFAADGRREEHPVGSSTNKAEQIVAGLGGAANIDEVEGCINRLRTEVKDPSLVDQAALKQAGAHGVVVAGTIVQVVVGPEADSLADDVNDLL